MEIRQVRTFVTIVETGSFTKAAQRLGYAQSTITSHIGSLELELGHPVFDRVGRRVILNEMGRKILPHAYKLLMVDKDMREIQGLDSQISGKLVIAAPEAHLIYRLPEIVKSFKDCYPEVVIELRHIEPMKVRELLVNGLVDIALMIDEETEIEDVQSVHLTEEPMVLISESQVSGDMLDKISGHTHILSEEGCSYRKAFNDLLAAHHLTSTKCIELWSIEAVKQYVLHDIGIAVLPWIAVHEEVSSGKLTAHKVMNTAPITSYYAYHQNKWLSPAFKAFTEMLEQHANEWKKEINILKF